MQVFSNKYSSIALAILCVVMWALPFSLIKIGMVEFAIASGDVGGEILFAGVRFFTAGLCALGIAMAMGRSMAVKGAKNWGLLFAFGAMNILLHYLFFYLGLGISSGGRSTVIYASSSFMLIILSCIFFADDKMSVAKAIGCVIGFSGICLVNFDFSNISEIFQGGSIGDVILLVAALSSAFGGLLVRVVTRTVDPIVATAYSLLIGGAGLVLIGLAFGGRLTQWTPMGIFILIVLILISAIAFVIYNQLLIYNPVSRIAIFNSSIPILGVIFSCFLLGEAFRLEYGLAAVLCACGVLLVNKAPKSKKADC